MENKQLKEELEVLKATVGEIPQITFDDLNEYLDNSYMLKGIDERQKVTMNSSPSPGSQVYFAPGDSNSQPTPSHLPDLMTESIYIPHQHQECDEDSSGCDRFSSMDEEENEVQNKIEDIIQSLEVNSDNNEQVQDSQIDFDNCPEVANQESSLKEKQGYSMKEFEVRVEKVNVPENWCKFCQKVMKNRNNLLKHIQNVHVQEYKYKCKLCKKPFKDQSSRDRHQSNIKLHERQKIDPKICTLCGKSFKSKFSRERHESVCKMK